MSIVRNCINCGAEIKKCMGFVIARDFLRLSSDERIAPRELCGKCELRMSLHPDRFARLLESTQPASL